MTRHKESLAAFCKNDRHLQETSLVCFRVTCENQVFVTRCRVNEKEQPKMTRLRLLLLVAILANFAALAAMGCFVAWWVPVGETILATLLGLAVSARTFAGDPRAMGDFKDSDGPPDGRLAAGLLLLAGGGLLFIRLLFASGWRCCCLYLLSDTRCWLCGDGIPYLGCPTTALDTVREHH